MPPPSRLISEPLSPSTSTARNFFFPTPYRVAGGASPLKPQRYSSTPRPARASTSVPPDDSHYRGGAESDVAADREASALRMLDVWSRLAEKYSRRIDEDDIVDLVTGEIVKDRGVLSAETPWQFPRFAADVEDAGSGSSGTDDDSEDIDELDFFAGTGKVSVDGWTVPPVRKMDPADAKDLEEFLKAEKQRREECGDEEASEDARELDATEDDAELAFSEDDTDVAVLTAPTVPSRQVEIYESDDELNNWNILDDSNLVSPAKTAENMDPKHLFDSPSPARRAPTPKPQKSSNSKAQPHLQLQTPPPSRTPSAADEISTPIASPLLPSQQSISPPKLRARVTPKPANRSPQLSSPTKSKAKAFPKAVERSISQIRTRSQSRGRSSPIHESTPQLDLVDARRGRSDSRRSARSSVARTEESAERPKALKRVGRPPAANRRVRISETKSVSRSPDSRRDSNLPSSPGLLHRATLGKGRAWINDSVVGDRKGKSRAMDVEQFLDDGQEESDDPLELPLSPPRPSKRHRPSPATVPKGKLKDHSREERIPSPEPLPRSTKKRKRKSSSFDSESSTRPADSDDTRASFALLRTQNKMRPSKSSRPSDTSVGAFHSESENETHPASPHGRPPQLSGLVPPYYPSAFYPYPSYPPPADVHPTIPLQDPRAQYIISQAMHQLSTLFTVPWPAQPLTLTRHSSPARSVPASGRSPYSYPTTPHHRNTYPYGYDPGASAATLPPSSPPSSSPLSSPLRGSGDGRRGSLVPRSRSRGRRVSFKLDGDLRHISNLEESSNNAAPSSGGKKQMVTNLSDSETEADEGASQISVIITPSRLSARAQTPGPPIPGPATVKPKGKPRKAI
ncbi:hypothetical protein DFH08DRAFT_835805 [Mycena albidolilacea]|uniref:Uncharacterized protein n=1 Tax=Mycena albidolilacea TaxID=1033008 RepID=A0AAD7AS19_9AGAR|nr:hypothetical protein DFH08DRAFT_835805 [Mycena albidolilacea]